MSSPGIEDIYILQAPWRGCAASLEIRSVHGSVSAPEIILLSK